MQQFTFLSITEFLTLCLKVKILFLRGKTDLKEIE
jgi:hypothetical protein